MVVETVETRCEDWCVTNTNSWEGSGGKCTYEACKGCRSVCASPPEKGSCKSWCSKNKKSWDDKCKFADCAGCDPCPTPIPSVQQLGIVPDYDKGDQCNFQGHCCKSWCEPKNFVEECTWSGCSMCDHCFPGISHTGTDAAKIPNL